MSFTKDPGRLAGLLYLLASIPGFFVLLYVPSKIAVAAVLWRDSMLLHMLCGRFLAKRGAPCHEVKGSNGK